MIRSILFSFLTVALVVGNCFAQQAPKQGQGQPTAPTTAVTPAQQPHTFKITPQEKEQKNPIRFTDISAEHGAKLYQSQCAMCHGEKGKGESDLAKEMNVAIPDLTKPSVLGKRTDGELFAIISQGSGIMPGQAKRMTERQRWDIVNFLRTIEGKTPAKATSEERQKAEEEHTVTVHNK